MKQSGDQINPAGNGAHSACQCSCAHTRQAYKAQQFPPIFLRTCRRPLWRTEVCSLTVTHLPHRQFPCQISNDQFAGTQGWKSTCPSSMERWRQSWHSSSAVFQLDPLWLCCWGFWGVGWGVIVLFCVALQVPRTNSYREKSIVLAFKVPGFNGQTH